MKNIGIIVLVYFLSCFNMMGQENKEITELLKKKYPTVLFLHGNYYEVRNSLGLDGNVGVCDLHGNEFIPCKYDDVKAYQFKDGDFCVVKLKEKRGIVNRGGKEVIPCGRYEYINYNPGCRYVVMSKGINLKYDPRYLIIEKIGRNGKWGIFDLAEGKEIVPCKYDYIKSEEDGVFAFNIGGKCMVDKPALTISIENIKGGKWGYIDINGKEVVPLQYDAISDFKDGVVQVKKDGVTFLLTHPLKVASINVSSGVGNIAVDTNIPQTNKKNENTFAFIIANENYAQLTGADFAINDGKVFASYCKKTLGIPEKNVRYYEDATYGNIVNAVKKMEDIAEVYDGESSIIFYFSGLGATDDNATERYLLATDANLVALKSTGYNVSDLLKVLNRLKTYYTWVVLEAPFSNLDKNGKALIQERGVAIKPKTINPQGNVIVSIASNGTQAAYADKKYGHGLFTYSLLEKLQQTNGNCTLKEITDYANQWTKKTSLSTFDKVQEPSTNVSDAIANKWKNFKL